MAITKDNVIAIAPELASVTDNATWAVYIADSAIALDVVAYEEMKSGLGEYIQRRLVAHMMVDNGLATGGRGTKGEVTKERVGDVERSYATRSGGSGGSIDDEDLRRTSYGRQILAIRRQWAGGPVWVGP